MMSISNDSTSAGVVSAKHGCMLANKLLLLIIIPLILSSSACTASAEFVGDGVYNVVVSKGREACLSSFGERLGFYNRSCEAGIGQDGEWSDNRAGPLLRDGSTAFWYQFAIKKVGETADGQDLVTIETWYPNGEATPRCMGYVAPFSELACNESPSSSRVIIDPNLPYQWRVAVYNGGETVRLIAQGRQTGCRRFLSVYADCSKNDVVLSSKDDGSGRQRWRLEQFAQPTPAPTTPVPTESPVTPTPTAPTPSPTPTPTLPTTPPPEIPSCTPAPSNAPLPPVLPPYNPPPAVLCNGLGEVADSNGACVCDPRFHFVQRPNGGCECDAANHFVPDGSGGCRCDEANSFALNNKGECEFCDPLTCAALSSRDWMSRHWYPTSLFYFTQETLQPLGIAFTGNNVPYVVLGYLVKVLKFNGDTWEQVFPFDVRIYSNTNTLTIASDPSDADSIYIAYCEADDHRGVVQRFNGKSWELVGGILHEGPIPTNFYSMVVSSNGTPYVMFADTSGLPMVKGLTSNQEWEILGEGSISQSFYEYSLLAIDSNDTLYAAYNQVTMSCIVYKYVDGTWEQVGDVAIAGNPIYLSGFQISSDGVPFVGFWRPNEGEVDLVKLDTSTDQWISQGTIQVSSYGPLATSFVLGPNDVPTFAANGLTTGTVSVWTLDDASKDWKPLGSEGFTFYPIPYLRLGVSRDGTAYLPSFYVYNSYQSICWIFQ